MCKGEYKYTAQVMEMEVIVIEYYHHYDCDCEYGFKQYYLGTNEQAKEYAEQYILSCKDDSCVDFILSNKKVSVLVPVTEVTGGPLDITENVLDWDKAVVFNKYNKLIINESD
jgi:hypothetical protein